MEIEKMISIVKAEEALKECETKEEVYSIVSGINETCCTFGQTLPPGEHFRPALRIKGQEGKVRIVTGADMLILEADELERTNMLRGSKFIHKKRQALSDFPPEFNIASPSMIQGKTEIVDVHILREPMKVFGQTVYFELGRVGFSREVVKKMGFDPIAIVMRQDEEIKRQDEVISDLRLRLGEATKPMYKKILNLVGFCK